MYMYVHICSLPKFKSKFRAIIVENKPTFRIHLIEKTLSCENYKSLTTIPDRFMGRCILSFVYSKNKTFWLVADASCTWQSKRCKST